MYKHRHTEKDAAESTVHVDGYQLLWVIVIATLTTNMSLVDG